MNDKQIDKGVLYLRQILNCSQNIEAQSTGYFQQLSIVLANFPEDLLYELLMDLLCDLNYEFDSNINSNNALIGIDYNKDEFCRNIYEFVILKNNDLKSYFENISEKLYLFQPNTKRTSTHNSRRTIKDKYIYMIECIADLILRKSKYETNHAGRCILTHYVCLFDTNTKKLFISNSHSRDKLELLLNYWNILKNYNSFK